MVRFALDEEFPETILEALRWGITEAELIPIRVLNHRMRGLDDWELLLALHHLPDIDGLITTDTAMLSQSREMAVIHQTRLTVVFVERAGDDPIRAAGLLLVHLPNICKNTVRSMGQIWKLNAKNKNHESPWDELNRIAKHSNQSAQALFQKSKLSKKVLSESPLSRLF